MNDKNTTNSQKVIEIADFLFKHPDKKMSEVLSYFVGKCRKNRRTVERYIKQAKEYNKNRIERQEKVRNNVLERETEKTVKLDILSRNESLEILSIIAKESKYNNDKIRAIQQLAKMEDWEAPTRINNNIVSKSTPEEAARFLKEVMNECEEK